MSFVIIGTPNDRRVELFQMALAARGESAANVISYRDVLQNNVIWEKAIPEGTVVRIESPGKSTAVQQLLIEAGGGSSVPLERGEWRDSAAWYRGLLKVLDVVKTRLAARSDIVWMNNTDDIALMFDKQVCHAYLSENGISVAPVFPPIHSYNELIESMRSLNRWRVFVKSRYGSSAAGVMAYRVNGDRHQATTTAELDTRDERTRLFNTRRLCVYRNPAIIGHVVDTLCRDGVHVETWIPKAGWYGKTFDLRLVVIGGVVRHRVMRLSHSPITNLHLLNQREDTADLETKMGAVWQSVIATCEQVAAAFPHSLYMGIDVAVTSDFRRHVVLEVNAFGDLLPGILDEGMYTYGAEIDTLVSKRKMQNVKDGNV